MYGFKDVFDGQLLVETILTSILFAENVVSLTFTDGINASVSNEIKYSLGGDDRTRNASAGAIDESFMQLIGRRVLRARLEGSNRLILDLDDDSYIELTDDLEMFECVVITTQDRVYVI